MTRDLTAHVGLAPDIEATEKALAALRPSHTKKERRAAQKYKPYSLADVLDNRARHYASWFLNPDRRSRNDARWVNGPSYVMQDLYNLTFKDEFDYMVKAVRAEMGKRAMAEFDRLAGSAFKTRDEAVMHALLKERMAVGPEGEHLAGTVGKVEVGRRPLGVVAVEVETPDSTRRRKRLGLPLHVPRDDRETHLVIRPYAWPIYAGEEVERQRIAKGERTFEEGGDFVDPLPDVVQRISGGALAFNMSAVAALAMLDALVDSLDVGAAAAEIRIRTGAQPADPDAAETGTLLATLPMSDPAFPNSADDADGTVSATASAITDDASADATGTAAYARAAATGAGADDVIDGSVGTTSSFDFNFNTASFVSGSTVSITSYVINLDQGSSAT